MPDFVQVNAAGLQTVFERSNIVQANSVGLTVVYSLEPDYGFVNVGAAGLTAVIDTAPPVKRVFPLPGGKTRWQSHGNVRKFPIPS